MRRLANVNCKFVCRASYFAHAAINLPSFGRFCCALQFLSMCNWASQLVWTVSLSTTIRLAFYTRVAGEQFYEYERRLDQRLRLRAFIEREYKRGTNLIEAREKLYYVYSEKAASEKQVKQWYDEFSRSGHTSSILRDYHHDLDCNHVDVQPVLRTTFKFPLIDKACPLFVQQAIQSRYFFFHDFVHSDCFYVFDTFHGDVQYVNLFFSFLLVFEFAGDLHSPRQCL